MGTRKAVFDQYPHIGRVLFSTPIHLCRLLSCNKPTLRVRYEYQDFGEPGLQEVLEKRMAAMA